VLWSHSANRPNDHIAENESRRLLATLPLAPLPIAHWLLLLPTAVPRPGVQLLVPPLIDAVALACKGPHRGAFLPLNMVQHRGSGELTRAGKITGALPGHGGINHLDTSLRVLFACPVLTRVLFLDPAPVNRIGSS